MSDTAKQAAPKAKADQTAPEADVKQGEAEAVTEAPPADEAEAAPAQPDMDEMKRKFREALDGLRIASLSVQGGPLEVQLLTSSVWIGGTKGGKGKKLKGGLGGWNAQFGGPNQPMAGPR